MPMKNPIVAEIDEEIKKCIQDDRMEEIKRNLVLYYVFK
jgi:hypothetical protein